MWEKDDTLFNMYVKGSVEQWFCHEKYANKRTGRGGRVIELQWLGDYLCERVENLTQDSVQINELLFTRHILHGVNVISRPRIFM